MSASFTSASLCLSRSRGSGVFQYFPKEAVCRNMGISNRSKRWYMFFGVTRNVFHLCVLPIRVYFQLVLLNASGDQLSSNKFLHSFQVSRLDGPNSWYEWQNVWPWSWVSCFVLGSLLIPETISDGLRATQNHLCYVSKSLWHLLLIKCLLRHSYHKVQRTLRRNSVHISLPEPRRNVTGVSQPTAPSRNDCLQHPYLCQGLDSSHRMPSWRKQRRLQQTSLLPLLRKPDQSNVQHLEEN